MLFRPIQRRGLVRLLGELQTHIFRNWPGLIRTALLDCVWPHATRIAPSSPPGLSWLIVAEAQCHG
jgi:hypothetical protein